MPLIVEDGTGLANAESYISAANADAYHANRGNAAWAALASQAIKEQYLRQATDYMQQAYAQRWFGTRNSTSQALDWPRAYVPVPDAPSAYVALPVYYATNIVPVQVINACAELALSAINGALAPDLARAQSEVKVGPIDVKYDESSPEATRFRKVDMLLGPLLAGGASMRRIGRS